MYVVYKDGIRNKKQKFPTYERARQWVRKQMRKEIDYRYQRQPSADMNELGYRIMRVDSQSFPS